MSGHCAAGIAIVAKNHSPLCAAEPDGRTQERIEYHLQVERRSADDLEHIGGGGLLVPRFRKKPPPLLPLVQQTCIFNRDHSLVGKCRDQLNLLFGEWPHRTARQHDHSDWSAFAHQRNTKYSAIFSNTTLFSQCVIRFCLDIGNMNSFFIEHRSPKHRSLVRCDWMISQVPRELMRKAEVRNEHISCILRATDGCAVGLA